MSDRSSQDGSRKKSSGRKAKHLEPVEKQESSIKRLRTGGQSSSPEVTENRLVMYEKFNKLEDSNSSSEEEEKETRIIPFATDISSNPLRAYNTFVCHLGDWKNPLGPYLKHKQFRSIFDFVKNEYDIGTCFPPKNLIFNAFQKTSFENLKIVMLGDAPSFKYNESMGLAYSTPKSMEMNPMMMNIFKALQKDPKVNFSAPKPIHGDVTKWADQGILMLNNSLTTREGKSGSHSKAGWKLFTKAILDSINKEKDGVVFLSWGGKNNKILKGIDRKKHHVLTYGNPSPLSQKFQKFEDCTNFSRANEILKEEGLSEIDWNLD